MGVTAALVAFAGVEGVSSDIEDEVFFNFLIYFILVVMYFSISI